MSNGPLGLDNALGQRRPLMRRLMLCVIGLAMAAATTGCLGISAQDNRKWGEAGNSQVVTVQGEVYVVNKRTGQARKVDLAAAKPYEKPVPADNGKKQSKGEGKSQSTK